MWKCPSCNEELNEDIYMICRKCGGDKLARGDESQSETLPEICLLFTSLYYCVFIVGISESHGVPSGGWGFMSGRLVWMFFALLFAFPLGIFNFFVYTRKKTTPSLISVVLISPVFAISVFCFVMMAARIGSSH